MTLPRRMRESCYCCSAAGGGDAAHDQAAAAHAMADDDVEASESRDSGWETTTTDRRGTWSSPAEFMLTCIGYSVCLLYTSPSPRDRQKSRMPSSA